MSDVSSNISGMASPTTPGSQETILRPIPTVVAASQKRSSVMIGGFLGLMILVGFVVYRTPHPKDQTLSLGDDARSSLPSAMTNTTANARMIPIDVMVTRAMASRAGNGSLSDSRSESLLDIRRKSPMVILNKQTGPSNPSTNSGATGSGAISGVPMPRGFSPSETTSVEASLLGDRDNLIAQGKLIDAVLETSIDSDHPGMLRALVSHDVHGDTGGNVLLPRGSRLIGQYDSAVAKGQNRVFVLWQRVIRPDGVDVQLVSAGTDSLGGTGIEGSVNNHFWTMFGAATLLSVIGSAASSVGVNPADASNSLSQYRENVTNGFNSAAGTVLGQFVQIKPTIKVHQGIEIKVFVARDLHFDPALVGGQEYQVIP